MLGRLQARVCVDLWSKATLHTFLLNLGVGHVISEKKKLEWQQKCFILLKFRSCIPQRPSPHISLQD